MNATHEAYLDIIREHRALREALRSLCAVSGDADRPSFANQGQAMDGFTMLAEYESRAKKGRIVLLNTRSGYDIERDDP